MRVALCCGLRGLPHAFCSDHAAGALASGEAATVSAVFSLKKGDDATQPRKVVHEASRPVSTRKSSDTPMGQMAMGGESSACVDVGGEDRASSVLSSDFLGAEAAKQPQMQDSMAEAPRQQSSPMRMLSIMRFLMALSAM